MEFTLQRRPGSNLLEAKRGNLGIIVNRLSDMKDMGLEYVKDSRGKWVLVNKE